MFEPKDGNTATCLAECPRQYSSNSVATKGLGRDCLPCDDSCQDCFDTSITDCTVCNAPDYKFRYKPTHLCKR